MKLLWQGTDVLRMMCFPPHIRFITKISIIVQRILARIIQPLIQTNYADHELLKTELEALGFKKVEVMPEPIRPSAIVKKKQHPGFNILFYCPNLLKKKNPKLVEWLYGVDLYYKIRSRTEHLNIKWFVVDGSFNMNDIFPVIDFYPLAGFEAFL